jgi:hypothetical protein
MVIETTTFRLAAGADEAAFLAADYGVQTEFVPYQRGFTRRTTARGADGEWIVVVLWDSVADAESCARLAPGDAAVAAFDALVDPRSRTTRRYETLD